MNSQDEGLADGGSARVGRGWQGLARVPLITLVLFLALAHPCSPLLPPVFSDEIYFTSGRSLKGLVVEEHVDRLVVSTVDGERVILRQEIDQVFFDDPERNYLYLGNEAFAQGDLNTAEILFRKALKFNPRWGEARDAMRRLGDERRKATSGWTSADPQGQLWSAWGMRLAATERYPVLVAVEPRGAAARAGLSAEDRIIAIWGDSMAFRPLDEVASAWMGPPGSIVKVTLERRLTLRARTARGWPGFDLTMTPLGLTVAKIHRWAKAAGLRPGDRLVTVNGLSTRYLPLASARAAIHKARRTGLTIVIHRDIVITRP